MITLKPLSLASKGVLDSEGALALSSKGVLTVETIDLSGCTTIPQVLATKGVLPCPTSSAAFTLATKGVLCCPIVIVPEPEPEPEIPFRQTGGGGGGISAPTWTPKKTIKVTVLCSGETRTQEVVVTPGIDVKAQILTSMELPENTVFVKMKRKPGK